MAFKENLLNPLYQAGTRSVDSTPTGIYSARFPLSGLTDSVPLLLSTSNQTIHTCSKTALDEVYIWVANTNASTRDLSFSINDSSHGTNTFVTTIAAKSGMVLVYPGIPHKNVSIFAEASANSSLLAYGFVVRQYPFNENSNFTGYGGTSD
jgi:hypothetical protein